MSTPLRTQSKLASLIEAIANTFIGFFISVTAQWLLFHLYGIKATVGQFLWLSAWMTVLSVVRSYCLRRMWNAEWWTRFKRTHPDQVEPPNFYTKEQVEDWKHRRKLVEAKERVLLPLVDIDPAHAKRWLHGDWETEPKSTVKHTSMSYCDWPLCPGHKSDG